MIAFWFVLIAVLCFIAFLIADYLSLKYNPFIHWRVVMNAKIKDWKDWIKKQSARLKERTIQRTLAIWKKTTFLKTAYIGVALFILYYLIKIFLNLRDQLFTDITKLDPEEMRNLAIAFLGTVSGIGALFGVYLAILRSETNERQTTTAEQGQITDRINKAVEMLGINDKDGEVIEVRLGALIALERIAQDSIRDHVQIMEILCAYARQNSDVKSTDTRADVQTALNIIARRERWSNDKERLKKEKQEKYRLNLRFCDFRGVRIIDGNLRNAWLAGANFKRVAFNGADVSGTWLDKANLNGTRFYHTKTNRVFAYDVDLSKCEKLTQKQLDVMFCGKKVKIPKMDGEKKITRPKHWPKGDLSYAEFMTKYWEWEQMQPDSYHD